jgi:malate dehydrogenase (oxaloacetate-decarboxylating)
MRGPERGYHVAADGAFETNARGLAVLHNPLINKDTAFSAEERAELGLTGLLPPALLTIEDQSERVYQQYLRQPDDLAKHVYLTLLRDRNETLFQRLLADHITEMLPIVYTPTVGKAIERYSHEYRRPRGVYLSIDDPDQIEVALSNFGAGRDDIDLIVATDAEAILGIGDWGVGGMDIAIGKLAVYTAAAGIDPSRVIPVMLDVGTDRESLLEYPLYIGTRHKRIRDERYDAFIDRYVATAAKLFPGALLHWEDFSADNARRILLRYNQTHCTFNDDMQGTGAVALAAAMAAARATSVPLRDQRVVLFGPGTAGIGIAEQLRDAMVRDGLDAAEAPARFWGVGSKGLLVEGMPMRDFQEPWARSAVEVVDWERGERGIELVEVVRRVRPTMLIGTSTVPGAFNEAVIRAMAEGTERPIVFPMSNPTHLCEAQPADILRWSDGRAVIATGSPFSPVTYERITHTIAQANNALLFPGLGLGTIVAKARLISDGMFAAAAQAVADLVDVGAPGASLLPQVEDLRPVSLAVAVAVVRQAQAEGLAEAPAADDVEAQVRASMWQPVYRTVRPRP